MPERNGPSFKNEDLDAVIAGRSPDNVDLLPVAELIDDLRCEYRATPHLPPGPTLAEFLEIGPGSAAIDTIGSKRPLQSLVSLRSSARRRLAGAGAIFATTLGKLLLGTAVTAAAMGTAQATNVVDIPGLDGPPPHGTRPMPTTTSPFSPTPQQEAGLATDEKPQEGTGQDTGTTGQGRSDNGDEAVGRIDSATAEAGDGGGDSSGCRSAAVASATGRSSGPASATATPPAAGQGNGRGPCDPRGGPGGPDSGTGGDSDDDADDDDDDGGGRRSSPTTTARSSRTTTGSDPDDSNDDDRQSDDDDDGSNSDDASDDSEADDDADDNSDSDDSASDDSASDDDASDDDASDDDDSDTDDEEEDEEEEDDGDEDDDSDDPEDLDGADGTAIADSNAE
ncbi:MAG: hypothetical protein ACR2QK_04075 [Acidimicrobiales bacterium]